MSKFADIVAEAKKNADALQVADETASLATKIRHRAEAVASSGILLAHRDIEAIAHTQYSRTRALEALQSFGTSESDRRILILSGSVGCGKTFAGAVAIASFGSGAFIASRELGRRFEPHQVELDAGITMPDLKQGLIVLDNLGAEVDRTDARWSVAFAAFIDHRQMHGKTIITTNLQAKEIHARYDARILDRLNDCAVFVPVSSESLRREGGF